MKLLLVLALAFSPCMANAYFTYDMYKDLEAKAAKGDQVSVALLHGYTGGLADMANDVISMGPADKSVLLNQGKEYVCLPKDFYLDREIIKKAIADTEANMGTESNRRFWSDKQAPITLLVMAGLQHLFPCR